MSREKTLMPAAIQISGHRQCGGVAANAPFAGIRFECADEGPARHLGYITVEKAAMIAYAGKLRLDPASDPTLTLDATLDFSGLIPTAQSAAAGNRSKTLHLVSAVRLPESPCSGRPVGSVSSRRWTSKPRGRAPCHLPSAAKSRRVVSIREAGRPRASWRTGGNGSDRQRRSCGVW